jgi:hypothetical protein
MRRTVVQVHDQYFDPRRIDPPRMLAAMLQALANQSDGLLRLDSAFVSTAAGDRWRVPAVDSIWQIPLAIRDLGQFLAKRIPSGHRIAKGAFAEIVMTNALLSTLDSYAAFLAPDARTEAEEPRMAYRQRAGDPAGTAFRRGVFARQESHGVLHIRPHQFGQSTADRVRNELQNALGDNAAGMVLDLRGHPGGSWEGTLGMIDLFLADGTSLILNGRESAQWNIAKDDGLLTERIKLVVLVDAETSSGAEMVAGALRIRDRALLVGETTAGHGVVETIFSLSGSGSVPAGILVLGTGEALLADARSFEGVGIAPDVEVVATPRDRRARSASCVPIGETIATVEVNSGEPDSALALALRILDMSPSARRADLLSAAKRVVASPPNSTQGDQRAQRPSIVAPSAMSWSMSAEE